MRLVDVPLDFFMKLCGHVYPWLHLLLNNIEPDKSLKVQILHVCSERVVELSDFQNRALNECKYDEAAELNSEAEHVLKCGPSGVVSVAHCCNDRANPVCCIDEQLYHAHILEVLACVHPG